MGESESALLACLAICRVVHSPAVVPGKDMCAARRIVLGCCRTVAAPVEEVQLEANVCETVASLQQAQREREVDHSH